MSELVIEMHPARRGEAGADWERQAFTADRLAGRTMTPRKWVVPDLIPAGTATTIDGDGGVGKSTLALQLAAAVVAGKTWLSRSVLAGRALYLSAEDDVSELHRRLGDICTHYDIGLGDLGDLKIWPLAGLGAELVATDDRGRKAAPTALWDELEAMALDWRPVLIVLDSRADVYGADEISRAQVRQFVSMLRRLGQDCGAGVVMLSHPSLAGMSSGSGSSGSTAWNNSVRSRLYFTRPSGEGADPDARVLTHSKANYGPRSDDIRLLRRAGVFEAVDGAPGTGLGRVIANNMVDDLFLQMLAQYAVQGRRVSDQTGANYAPALFSKDPIAAGTTAKGFASAMNRHFAAGRIKIEEVGPASRRRRQLVVAATEEGA